MDRNELSLRLLSAAMTDELHMSRLGFWLRMAREHSGKSQAGAAQELKLSSSSKSTISDWDGMVGAVLGVIAIGLQIMERMYP